MKKKWILCAGVSLLLLFFITSQARSFDDQNLFVEKIQDKIIEHLDRELNLSDEQKEQIKTQSRQAWEQNKLVLEQLKTKLLLLREEIEKPASDPQDVKAIIQEINVLRGMLLTAKVDNVVAIKETLTQDQFALLKEKIHARRAMKKAVVKKFLEVVEGML